MWGSDKKIIRTEIQLIIYRLWGGWPDDVEFLFKSFKTFEKLSIIKFFTEKKLKTFLK
jgi:hypothetical protein